MKSCLGHGASSQQQNTNKDGGNTLKNFNSFFPRKLRTSDWSKSEKKLKRNSSFSHLFFHRIFCYYFSSVCPQKTAVSNGQSWGMVDSLNDSLVSHVRTKFGICKHFIFSGITLPFKAFIASTASSRLLKCTKA